MKSFFTILFIIANLNITAQKAITASGGNTIGIGGSVSYTIGQVFYNKNTGTNGFEIQGVQQPYEISVVSRNENFIGTNFTISIYPNPVNDCLYIRLENFDLVNSYIELFDSNGKLLKKVEIKQNEISIEISNFDPGTYFLKVMNGNKEVKTFKILKNNIDW